MGWLPAVVTNPGAVLQNLIQPVADDVCLTLRPFSDAQVNAVFRVQNAAGTKDVVNIGLGSPAMTLQGTGTGAADTQLLFLGGPGFTGEIFSLPTRVASLRLVCPSLEQIRWVEL